MASGTQNVNPNENPHQEDDLEDFDDDLSDLFLGQNHIEVVTLRNGKKYRIRSGSRSERNAIEAKFGDEARYMDAVALLLFHRLADVNGNKLALKLGETIQTFHKRIEYNRAVELSIAIKRLDNLSLNDKSDEDDPFSEGEDNDLEAVHGKPPATYESELLAMGNDSKPREVDTSSSSTG